MMTVTVPRSKVLNPDAFPTMGWACRLATCSFFATLDENARHHERTAGRAHHVERVRLEVRRGPARNHRCFVCGSGVVLCKACERSYDRTAHREGSVAEAMIWAVRRALRVRGVKS